MHLTVISEFAGENLEENKKSIEDFEYFYIVDY
jgi:hypothetical protein